jgi:hypothetical protein
VRRRLFNLAAAVSLTLTVATLVLWVRSYRRADVLQVGNCALASGKGKIGLHHWTWPSNGGRFFVWESEDLTFGDWDRVRVFVPLTSTDVLNKWYSWQFYVPTWLPAGTFGLLGLLLLRRNWPRHREGSCPRCGYDLRASPDRCPECGTEVKPQPAKGAAA